MIQSLMARAAEAKVCIALSPQGTIDITGPEDVVARWLPELRENKARILVALLDFEKSSQPMPKHQGIDQARKSSPQIGTTPPPEAAEAFKAGFPWITAHLAELLAAGWTRRELFGRGRYRWPVGDWGVAWASSFGEARKVPSIGGRGEIVFTFANANGEQARQTAWPARNNYGIDKGEGYHHGKP